MLHKNSVVGVLKTDDETVEFVCDDCTMHVEIRLPKQYQIFECPYCGSEFVSHYPKYGFTRDDNEIGEGGCCGDYSEFA